LAKAKKNPRAPHSKPTRSRTAIKRPRDKRTPSFNVRTAAVAPDRMGMAPMSTGRRVSWWALLAMVFLVPLATSNFTVLGFHQSFTADAFDIVKVSVERMLGLIALAAWAWDLLRRGGRARHTPIDWVILGFLVWIAITTVTSVHWPTALLGRPRRYEGLVSFLNYALIYFLVLQLADHASRIRRLAQALFWSSVIVAAFGVLQFLGVRLAGWQPLGFEANRAFSTYGNPDFLGGFLIFSVTVALGLALLEQRSFWRMVYWAGLALNGVALVVSFTRGAWIGGVISLAVLAVAAWRQRATMRRTDWAPAVVAVAVAVAIIWRSLSSSSEVLNFGKRIASIFQFGSGSGQSRTQIWQAAVTSIKHRPVQGWGPDTFRLVFTKYKSVEYVQIKGGSSGADNAHDYLLQLASGTGIPGALIFCGIFVWAGIRSFKTIFKRSDQPIYLILAAFWAASAGYLVHLLFGISVTGVTFLLWIGLALVLVPSARVLNVKAFKWGTVVALVVIVLAAAGIIYQGVYLAADRAYQQSQTAGTLSERTAGAVQAARLIPLNPEYRLAVGLTNLAEMRAYLQTGAEAQQKGLDTSQYEAAVRRTFADAETALKGVIAFIPGESDNYVALASLYNLGAETVDKTLYQSAIDTCNRGLEVMPLSTAIRVQLAQALVATGNTADAVKALQYCLNIDPSDGEAALALAAIYRQLGQTAEALTILKAVDARAPGQSGIADAIKQLETELSASS
jgi:O-antigen ligase